MVFLVNFSFILDYFLVFIYPFVYTNAFLPWEKNKTKQNKNQTKNHKQTNPNQIKLLKQLPSVVRLISGLSTVTQADFSRTLPLIIRQATFIQYAKASFLQDCLYFCN